MGEVKNLKELSALRKKIKIRMAEKGCAGRGALKSLAGELGVNYKSLSMALSGYRNFPRAHQMLVSLLDLLESRNRFKTNNNEKK